MAERPYGFGFGPYAEARRSRGFQLAILNHSSGAIVDMGGRWGLQSDRPRNPGLASVGGVVRDGRPDFVLD